MDFLKLKDFDLVKQMETLMEIQMVIQKHLEIDWVKHLGF